MIYLWKHGIFENAIVNSWGEKCAELFQVFSSTCAVGIWNCRRPPRAGETFYSKGTAQFSYRKFIEYVMWLKVCEGGFAANVRKHLVYLLIPSCTFFLNTSTRQSPRLIIIRSKSEWQGVVLRADYTSCTPHCILAWLPANEGPVGFH